MAAQHLGKVSENCPYFSKTGDCRHGNRCFNVHQEPSPSESATVLLRRAYQMQCPVEDYLKDLFRELSQFGYIRDVFICDHNIPYHLSGHTYLLFQNHNQAKDALEHLRKDTTRIRNHARIDAKLCTREISKARCQFYVGAGCKDGAGCGFLHLMGPERRRIIELQRRYGHGHGHVRDRRTHDGRTRAEDRRRNRAEDRDDRRRDYERDDRRRNRAEDRDDRRRDYERDDRRRKRAEDRHDRRRNRAEDRDDGRRDYERDDRRRRLG